MLKPDILRSQVNDLAEPRAGFDQKIEDDAQLQPKAIENTGGEDFGAYKLIAE